MADIVYQAEFQVSMSKLRKAFAEAGGDAKKLDEVFKSVGQTIEKSMSGSANTVKGLAGTFSDLLPNNVKKAMSLFKQLSNSLKLDGAKTGIKDFSKSLVSGMGAGVKSAWQFGVALNAATGGLLLIIGAVVGLAVAIGKGVKAAGEYNQKLETSKRAHEGIEAIIQRSNTALNSQKQRLGDIDINQQAIKVGFKKIMDFITEKLSPVTETWRRLVEGVAEKIKLIVVFLGLATEEELEQAAIIEKNAEQISEVDKAQKQYENTVKKIKLAESDIVKQEEARLSAMNSLIDTIAEQLVLMEVEDAELKGELAALVEQRDRLAEMLEISKDSTAEDKKQTRELTEQEKIALEIEAAEKKHEDTLRRINEQLLSGRLTQEEADQQTHGAMETWADDLRGIVDKYGDINNAAVALLAEKEAIAGQTKQELRDAAEEARLAAEADKADKLRMEREDKAAKDREDAAEDLKDIEEQIAQQEIDKLKTLAAQAENIDLQNFLYEEAYKAEVDLIKQQRKRQLEMYKTTDAFKAMQAAGDGSAEAFEEAWETATQNTINAIEKIKGKTEEVAKKVEVTANDIVNQAVETAAAAMNLMTQLVAQDAEARIAEVEKELEETQKAIDEFYKKEQERLDEERQAALEAAGLAASASSANLEAAMQAAMDSMDAQVIYKEQQRQKELAINKEFDAKEKALADKQRAETEQAEKDAAQKKLDIQYEADMAEWRANLVKGTADIAMGVIKAWAQGGGAAGALLAGLVTVAGALQMASLIASAPKKQSLASGGIVEGSGPRGVDSVDTMLAPKEMVLNDSQQARLFSMIQQGSGGAVTQTIILEVDGQVLAQVTINAVNNGFGPLIQRVRLA